MKIRSIVVCFSLLLSLISFCSTGSPASELDQRVVVAGDVPKAVLSATLQGRLASTTSVTVALTLPVRNADELTSLISRLYDPSSPDYGHYLNPTQFAGEFGATEADYEAVEAFSQSEGLTVTQTHPNRLLLDVSGPASAVENAFGVHLYQYVGSDGRIFRAPDLAPSVPATMATCISGVVGLSDAYLRHPQVRPRSEILSRNSLRPLNGTGPESGLSPTDVKTAYGLSGLTINGTGQTAAVYELDGYNASDIAAYESELDLPVVPLQNVILPGASGAAGQGVSEVELDIELIVGLAPGMSKLLVYETGHTDTEGLDGYARIADDDLAKTISTSWGLDEQENDTSYLNSENTIFQQMAAQGQSIFAASGDNGAYDSGNKNDGLRVDDPASQPYVCGVGGTTLTTTAPGGAWESETTWNGGSISIGAGGGGISSLWSIPGFQKGYVSSASKGSTSKRNVPDVSINADPQNGYSIFLDGGWTVYGGTSAGAPLWAAFGAIINEKRAEEGKATIGEIMPLIYPLIITSSYATDFHDIKDGSTNFFYPAVSGYDDATGIGTPIVANLIATLAPSPVLIPAAPTDLAAVASDSYVTLAWIGNTTASSYLLYRSTSSTSGFTLLTTLGRTTYVDSSAADGVTYYYYVKASNSAGASSASNTVSATPLGPVPLAPTDLTATAGNTVINLSWTGSSGSVRAYSYKIYRSTSSNGSYILAGDTTDTSFISRGLTNGTTYYYYVTGIDDSGASPASNIAFTVPIVITPGVPTDLTATAGDTSIDLRWNASANAQTYNIYQSTSPSSGYSLLVTTTTTTAYSERLTNGTTYYFVVTAVNMGVASAGSNVASATPFKEMPATPTDLTAKPGDAEILLTWNGTASAGAYNVYRSTSANGTFAKVATVSSASDTDTHLTNGTTYYYVVTAVKNGVSSAGSNTASATPSATAIFSPTITVVTPGNAKVLLTWSSSSTSYSYDLYRSVNASSGFAKVVTITSTSYVDTSVTNGTTYYYVVTAVLNGVASAGSNMVSATPNSLTPDSPTDLTAYSGNAALTLTWNSSAGAITYNLYRSTSVNSGFTKVATTSVPRYVDSGLTNSMNYYYVVTAVNNGVASTGSNTAYGSPSASIPLAPANLIAAPGNAQVSLSWTGSASVTSYNIYRSTSAGTGYVNVASTSATTFVNTGLVNGTTYYYLVTAVRSGVASASSNTASAQPAS